MVSFFRRAAGWMGMCLLVLLLVAPAAQAQDTAASPVVPVSRTEGPRETLTTFAETRAALEAAVRAYRTAPTRAGVTDINLLIGNLRGLIDLDEVPVANRHRVGTATALALLDIFGRVDLPDMAALPETGSEAEAELDALRLGGTPLRLLRKDEGPRAGEWLFASDSVTTAPRFLAGVEDVPLQSTLGWATWSDGLPQLAGPFVPAWAASAMPDWSRTLRAGLPVWKWGALLIGSAAVFGALLAVARWVRVRRQGPGPRAPLLSLMTPLLALAALQVLLPGFARQLMPFSQMPDAVALSATLLSFAALAWLFWVTVQALVALRSAAKREDTQAIDRDLLRVIGTGIGAFGVLVIATTGAQRLGIPVVSLAAGLGIGGLAVALAVRPALENLVGGLALYTDRPVRIGDFCTFGEHSGTVERIGMRAVWVRALDRTLISIPNARFADMDLINWAACDMMLIQRVLRLRLETSTDQTRFVLAEIRKMLHAHPRIDDATIRVRYLGIGEVGREIDLRYYARTREWNEFFAIREDTLLRVDAILDEAGARVAVPVQVLHMARDQGGTDPDRQAAAEARVGAWREAGTLPFPRFAAADLARLDDTLDYPPDGSPDAGSRAHYRAANPETLSREPASPLPDRTVARPDAETSTD